MEIKDMAMADIEARIAEITTEADTDITEERALELTAELDALEARKAEIAAEAEKRAAAAAEITAGQGTIIEDRKGEPKIMSNAEIRNSDAYINAYATYIKTGKDAECRALLTELVEDGTVPVPEFVEGIITHAWDEMPILSRCAQMTVKGIVKLGYEKSAGNAVYHDEGADAPEEEKVELGIVELTPQTIKKWITVSDEALAMNAVSLLTYLYNEISYRIFRFAEDEVVKAIKNSDLACSVDDASADAEGLIDAQAALSDEATNLVAIMSKSTAASIKKSALNANYAYDPFDGLTVLNNDSIGDAVIVGDLKGCTVNFPEGNNITFKYDDLSLAEKDLVKIVGRLPFAVAVSAEKRFAVINDETD